MRIGGRAILAGAGLVAGVAMLVPGVAVQAADTAPLIAPVTARWHLDDAKALVKLVASADAEGLDPQNYRVAILRRAVQDGEGAGLDAAADAAAFALAHDYAFGRVGDRAGMDWYIDADAGRVNALGQGLQAAIAAGGAANYIEGLLPTDRRYVALRTALADAPDRATRDRLRVNMERWRWMPRDLGSDYLYVNVPSYRLQVMDGGAAVSTYTVVVGAKDTPTPVLASPSSSLVVNPWWNVPQSIVKKSNLRPGRAGFVFKASANGYAVRQPPGPRNALGRIKFNLVNDQAIYLHDTPAKSGFARDERALSHGCIRVKDIDRLAAELMEDGGGDTGQLDAALASDRTATLRLPKTWQVYLVYFTADADADGKVVTYGDPYGRDAQVIARLDGGATQMASR